MLQPWASDRATWSLVASQGLGSPGYRSRSAFRAIHVAPMWDRLPGRSVDSQIHRKESGQFDESAIECPENLRELQDGPSQGQTVRDLHESAAQAASGLTIAGGAGPFSPGSGRTESSGRPGPGSVSPEARSPGCWRLLLRYATHGVPGRLRSMTQPSLPTVEIWPIAFGDGSPEKAKRRIRHKRTR